MAKQQSEATSEASAGTPRLLEHYRTVVRPALVEKFGAMNPHAIPGL